MDPIISPQALARTYSPVGYDDAWDLVEDYFAVAELAAKNPDETPYRVAQLLGVSKYRVKNWFNGAKPDVIRALEEADSHGWDDTPWESHLGHAFNILVASIYGSGSLNTSYQPSVSLTPDIEEADQIALQAVMETIIGTSKITQKNDPHRPPVLKPGENAGVLGRALTTLGVPKGSKTVEDYSLPEYLSRVPESLRREFIEVYVLLRGYHSSDDTRGMDFREERSEDYLNSLASLIADVTGHQPTVRTNGIYLPVDVVDNLSLSIEFPPENKA